MSEPSLIDLRNLIDRELALTLERHDEPCTSKRLSAALKYALSSPGKRLRPLMVLGAAHACRANSSAAAVPGACAVEYVHTYSLVHDDLPCMDDDDFRRGRLSVHRQFDEALAVLAGDGLLADAFTLASSSNHNAVLIMRELALTAGSGGLVAGQAEDLIATNSTTLQQWLAIHNAKTARLFEACAVIGGLAVDASSYELKALRQFGCHFGMAFQIKDDVDDQSGIAKLDESTAINTVLNEHLTQARNALDGLKYPFILAELLQLTFATAAA